MPLVFRLQREFHKCGSSKGRLTGPMSLAKGAFMTRTPLLITLLAAAALAGCDSQGNTIVQQGPPDTMANELKNAPPVELPPAIIASHPYRCKDNSLVYIDWLADNKGANFRASQTDIPVQLKPGAEGKPPFAAEGYSLAGAPSDSSVTLVRPDKGSQTCRRG